jgi:tripartite-type tricarboxylate transporter receptor subunit TctC
MKKLVISILFILSASMVNAATTITVPHPPGGSPDIWARIVAKHLAQEINTEVVVSNNPSAAGRVAVDFVAQQPADGKNLIAVTTGPFLFNKVLFKSVLHDYNNFDTMVPMTRIPMVLAVSNSLKVSSLKDFINVAQSKSLNCAGSSSSAVFVGKYLMKQIKSQDVQFIPFKGSADMNVQLAAGNIDCAFDTTLATMPFHQANRFKIIATSTDLQILPDTGLFKSVVPGLVFYYWTGIGIKVNTANKDYLFRTLHRISQNTEYQSAVKKAGFELVDSTVDGSQWLHQEFLKFESMREQLNIPKE